MPYAFPLPLTPINQMPAHCRNLKLPNMATGDNSNLSEAICNFRFFSGAILRDSATDDSADSGSAVFPLTVATGRY